MSYVDVYRMWFTNDKGDDVIIHISDTTSGEGDSIFHDMKDADGNWLTMSAKLSSANDGEDKRSPIRSTRFSVTFLSTATYNVDFFLAGEDNRWLVELYIGTVFQPTFIGYCVPDGAKELLLDHELFGVELTFSDMLNSIDDQPLRKPDGTIPKGHFRLIDFISWALQKTGLQLQINAAMNLREEHHTGAEDAAFEKVFVDALTFETDINERESYLSVLEKILRAFGCFVTQYNSEWWIIRVAEMNDTDYRLYSWNFSGTYLGNSPATYEKRIGINETIQLINEDASVYPERQIQFAKQTIKFEKPQEIICNINISRGTLNGSISVPSGYEAYNPVECWFNGKNPDGSSPTGPDVDGYMRKKIENGYETERVLVLPASSYRPHYWQTETVDVNQRDKFTFSVDQRLTSDHTGSGYVTTTIFKIRLRGFDGSYWSMIGNAAFGKVGSWKQGIGGFPVQHFEWQYKPNDEDETQWHTHSVDVDPCPVAGKIDIMLFQTNVFGDVNDTHFANLQFNLTPIIDGVYQIVSGQYHKVSNTDDRKANRDETIYISDMANPNWKGNVKRYNGTNYVMGGLWYDYLLGTSGGLGLERLGKWQVYDLWNQHNRVIRKITGKLSGLDTNTTQIPSMIHRFVFTAPGQATENKYYQLLSFDMDLASCEWDGTFADVYDTTVGFDYGSTHEFKYTTK